MIINPWEKWLIWLVKIHLVSFYCLLSRVTDGLSFLVHMCTHPLRKKTESWGWRLCWVLKGSGENLMLYSDRSQISLLLFLRRHRKYCWLKHYIGWPMINNARFTHFIGLLRKINPGTQMHCSPKCMDQLICIVYPWVLIRFKTNALYYDISREWNVQKFPVQRENPCIFSFSV